MGTIGGLYYKTSRKIVENKENYIVVAEVRLDDECKNHVCDWSVTGEMYKCDKEWKRVKSEDEYCVSGAIGDVISKYMPELRGFEDIHLHNYLGQPMYPVENGIHWMRQGLDRGMDYLHATKEEAEVLSADLEDIAYFKYQLFALGIVDRWKAKSDEMIKRLEEMTGKKWMNPYSPEEERFVLRISYEEIRDIEGRIAAGYYSKDAIQKRIDDRRAKKRKEIENKYDEKMKDAIDKIGKSKMVYLYLFDRGITNAIYYEHSNSVKFNWKDYEKKITKEEFDEFVRTCDMSKLPEGITFKLNNK